MQATGNTRNPVRHIAALSALLAAAGCASAQAATPITFITNWYAQAEHGGFYQALADGLYAEKGLDVSIRMGGPQVNSAQLLAAGQAQCIIKDDIGTVMARQQGIPLTTHARITWLRWKHACTHECVGKQQVHTHVM